MNKKILTVCLALLGTALLLTSCKKAKIGDFITQPGGLNQSNSTIRVYNLFGFDMDVTVNNIPLTPYGTNSGNTYAQAIFGGGYFKDGGSFTVPNTILDKAAKAHIILTPHIVLGNARTPNSLPQPIDTTITNNPTSPQDYFVLSSGHLQAIPHSLAAPSKPSNFKIRIINLSAPTDVNQITGAVTMTYADGTLVDPAVTNIAMGATSAYVELPYGSYEFKLYIANGQQIDITKQLSIMTNLPGSFSTGPKPNYLAAIDPGIPVYVQEQRFSAPKTYEPGGTYTLFVSQNIGQYIDDNQTLEFVPLNSFRVVTETSAPLNVTFARLQTVNTLPAAGGVIFKVDGTTISSAMPFGAHSDYQVFVQGTHTVEADDAKGNILVKKDINLYANDDITAWIYNNDNKPSICFSSNDMSVVNNSVVLQLNFMNLSSNVPYTTFLAEGPGGGGSFTDANDTLGKPAISADPYYNVAPNYDFDLTPGYNNGTGDSISVRMRQLSYLIGHTVNGNIIVYGPNPFVSIYAFQSSPAVVPGQLLADINPLTLTSFIANPDLYSPGMLPPGEPGAYTVALIGTEGAIPSNPFYPRMLVLKHNK